MLQNWLKVAFANYKKNWLATVINITGLTIALSVFVLVTLFWNSEASYESWVPNKEYIYMVEHADSKGKKGFDYWSSCNVKMADVARHIPQVQESTSYKLWGEVFLSTNDKTIYVKEDFYIAENNFFKFIAFPLVYGNYNSCLKDENTIAISENISAQLFGKQNPVGKELFSKTLERRFIIGAVYKLPNTKTNLRPAIVIPYTKAEYLAELEQPTSFSSRLFLKIQPKDKDIVAKKLKVEFYDKIVIPRSLKYKKEKTFNELRDNSDVQLVNINRVNLHSKSKYALSGTPSDYKLILTIFSLGLLLLLLSIVNFINLNTAIAIKRAKESGLRKALGGTRIQIIRQLLLETFILCLVSFILSLIVSSLLLTYMSGVLKMALPSRTPVTFYLLLFAIIVAISFVCGIIPAYYISRFKAVDVLKGNYGKSKSSAWIRRVILTLQLSISSFFIICGIITYRQVNYMITKDLGFKGDQTVLMRFSSFRNATYNNYLLINDLFGKIEEFQDIAACNMSPAGESYMFNTCKFENKTIESYFNKVGYDYFKILKINLVAGRYLSPQYASDTISNCLINEAFAREFYITPDKIIGKSIIIDDNKTFTIVGVVKDFHFSGFDEKIKPTVFYSFLSDNRGKAPHVYRFLVKISKENIPQTIKKMEKIWTTSIEPGEPMTYEFVDKTFAKYFEDSQRQMKMFFIMTIAVLLVSLLGLFALSSFMMQQRLREVAIRKTLGADNKKLIYKLTQNYLIMTTIGVIISIPFAYYFMNKWLSGFAYRIDMPWMPYVLSFILLLALTFAVVSIKARAATKVKVIKWLKYE